MIVYTVKHMCLAACLAATVACNSDEPVHGVDFHPVDSAAGDMFGWSVAIGDNYIVASSRNESTNGVESGAVYIYDKTSGEQIHKLFPLDGKPRDQFGWAVAIENETVVVGARWRGLNGAGSGSVFVYNAITGEKLHELTPHDHAAGELFGWSVDIDDGVIVVGSKWDSDNGKRSGSAYLYDASTGNEIGKLLAEDGQPEDIFGCAVAIEKGIACIGARRNKGVAQSSGAVYVFDVATSQQVMKIVPEDGKSHDSFGRSIDIEQGLVVVGSRLERRGEDSGSAYIFDVSDGTQIAKLVPEDKPHGAWFGASVSIDDGIVVVGAPYGDVDGIKSGTAYVFDIKCVQLAKLTRNNTSDGDQFGVSVGVSGGVVVVGSPSRNRRSNLTGEITTYNIINLTEHE